MSIDESLQTGTVLTEEIVRQYLVEKFYTEEAALLDAKRFEEWVEMFSEDTHYFMPIRRTRLRRELAKEFTEPGEMAFFDDTKMALRGRVAKIATGTAWAEDPPSRTRHIITNVRVTEDSLRPSRWSPILPGVGSPSGSAGISARPSGAEPREAAFPLCGVRPTAVPAVRAGSPARRHGTGR